MVRLSAIVPAANGPPTLERCTAALRGGLDDDDELIVVAEPRDANPAHARNIGVEQATGEILLFVDSDVEVHADAVERIRAAFESDEELVALFGSYDDAPGAPGVVSGFRNLLHHHVHQSARGPATTFWTGLGAVRRDAFLSVGGFDERLAWLEDVDLGMRLAAGAAHIELDPDIQGKHLKAWSLWAMLRTDFIGRGVPWIVLVLRHRGSTETLNLTWRHRLSAGACVVGAGALVLRRPAVAAGAAVALVALNHSFYRLLLRQRGPVEATAGVFLHALHHLTGVAAVPVGVARHLLAERAARNGRP